LAADGLGVSIHGDRCEILAQNGAVIGTASKRDGLYDLLTADRGAAHTACLVSGTESFASTLCVISALYLLLVVDDCNRYMWTAYLRTKDQALGCLQQYVKRRCTTATLHTISLLKIDVVRGLQHESHLRYTAYD
jgi:hypothetical protein